MKVSAFRIVSTAVPAIARHASRRRHCGFFAMMREQSSVIPKRSGETEYEQRGAHDTPGVDGLHVHDREQEVEG
jgi:hypothetical protein